MPPSSWPQSPNAVTTALRMSGAAGIAAARHVSPPRPCPNGVMQILVALDNASLQFVGQGPVQDKRSMRQSPASNDLHPNSNVDIDRPGDNTHSTRRQWRTAAQCWYSRLWCAEVAIL